MVLAAAEACQVGVDVMTYEIPGKREISVLDFFASFREQVQSIAPIDLGLILSLYFPALLFL